MRLDFVSFRQRLERLVRSLVALRNISPSRDGWPDQPEGVEIQLDADDLRVTFIVGGLSWEAGTEVAWRFQRMCGPAIPLLADAHFRRHLMLAKAGGQTGQYQRLRDRDRASVTFQPQFSGGRSSIEVRTGLDHFDDHFETFVTDVARLLFPTIAPEPPRRADTLDEWHASFGRDFEALGCRVFREETVGWRDLAGLDRVRAELERAVLVPLVRQDLHAKVARAVLPPGIRLLPRGVLLAGPPGTGKTWIMRALAREAGLPVIALPCDALMTRWYGESERRLGEIFALCRGAGRMLLLIDEIDALARHRADAHETTARLVSILLAEMDGLAGSSDVLLVGSANSTTAIDPAVLDRFDVQVAFDLPDLDQRRVALAYYARQLAADDVAHLAARMEGWNFRRLARFAEAVVRGYVSRLDISQLEAKAPPVPGVEDYEREMEVVGGDGREGSRRRPAGWIG